MNEEPKSIWKKPWKGARGLFSFGLAILVAAFLIIFFLDLLVEPASFSTDSARIALIWATVIAIIGFMMVAFVRWTCHWRNFKRFLLGLAGFVLLIALFYAEENWRGKHDWEQFKRGWEAKGMRFGPAAVIPTPVPDNQNFAMSPVFDAVNKLMNEKWRAQHQKPHSGKEGDEGELDTILVDPLEMVIAENGEDPTNAMGDWRKSTMSNLAVWQQSYRVLSVTTNTFPIPQQPQTPAKDVLLALSLYDPTIEELREAAKLPYARFPISYDAQPPANIWLSHLAGLKQSARVLELRAIAELQNGQSDKALADVELMLRLSDSIRMEPFLISHLVRIAIVNRTLQPVWEGLVAHQWSDEQLERLGLDLAKVDSLADYHTAMRGELVLCEIGNIEFLRHYPEHARDLLGEFNEDASARIVGRIVWQAIPSGWFYQNELSCARPMLEDYLPLADIDQHMVRPGAVERAGSVVGGKLAHRNPYNIITRIAMPAVGGAVKKFACGQESVDLAQVAIALERYRLANGKYPEALEGLTPQLLARLPHDIINGEPLHYRRTTDDQFVLYSVGWNGTDDGGAVVLSKGTSPTVDINEGDWVWHSSVETN